MIVLVSDSSTLLGSVALFEDLKLLSARESMRRGSHSDIMNRYVEQVLTEAGKTLHDVDLFASGVGPGSFTGIRISLNMMKTFAYCFSKPVIGINSLETLAFQAGEQKRPIISMINAYKNMVYIGTYQWISGEFKTLRSPEVVRVQNLTDYVQHDSLIVGDGYQAYEPYFPSALKAQMHRQPVFLDEPRAANMGALIAKHVAEKTHWAQLLPIYLRASEAEENSQGIKFQPLV